MIFEPAGIKLMIKSVSISSEGYQKNPKRLLLRSTHRKLHLKPMPDKD